MLNIQDDFKNFEMEGTVFGSINKDSFRNLKFSRPPHNLIQEFEDTCYPIDQQIEINVKQNDTLAELRDAVDAFRMGVTRPLKEMIRPPESALAGLPGIVIRNSAVDALCHGASLAGVGIVSCGTFRKGDRVAVLTQKGELVCTGKALVSSVDAVPGKPGLVAAPERRDSSLGGLTRGGSERKKGGGPKHPE